MSKARRSWRRWRSAVIGAGLLAAAMASPACGLEDPGSIAMRRGALSLGYPQSLHVGTAVWQAQLAGRLPRDPLAQRAELSPESRGALRLMRAQTMLGRLALRLGGTNAEPARPKLALVLLGPVLWARFEPVEAGQPVRPLVHVPGPEEGDVVLVTDIAVVEAVVGGELGFAAALESGLARLYGAEGEVGRVREWLVRATPG